MLPNENGEQKNNSKCVRSHVSSSHPYLFGKLIQLHKPAGVNTEHVKRSQSKRNKKKKKKRNLFEVFICCNFNYRMLIARKTILAATTLESNREAMKIMNMLVNF